MRNARVSGKAWELLQPALGPAGFRPKGARTFYRVCDNLLQFVSLTVPRGSFTVEIAIMPLFVPSNTWTLAFGGRLGRLIDGLTHWYETGPDDAIMSGLRETEEHLRQYALPWFDQLKTVRSLAQWYADGGTPLGGSRGSGLFGRLPIYLGYCHAYLGEFSTAVPLIKENLQKAILPHWDDYQPTLTLLDALQNDPGRVPGMLECWITETKRALGIG